MNRVVLMMRKARFVQQSSCNKRVRLISHVPGPKPLPIFGNLNLFKPFGPYALDRVNEAAANLQKEFGPIVRLQLGIDIVFLFDPKDVATVFRNEGKYPLRPSFEALAKHRRKHSPDRYLHMGLFTDNGVGWSHTRSLVNCLLRPDFQDPYLDGQLDVADDFVEHLKNIRNSNRRVTNILDELYKYTQEAAGLVCFGTRLGCFGGGRKTEAGARVNSNVADMLNSLAVTLLSLPVWKVFPTPAYVRLVRSQENMWTIVAAMVEAARQRLFIDPNTEKRQSPFLSSLLQMNGLDHRDLVLVIMELFQAGIDSTASTIGMTLYHVGRNPRVQQQLIDEIDRLLPGKDDRVTAASIAEFKYLRACVKETFRLTCPVGGSARILPATLSLSGHAIPAGTLVVGNHPVMSVNPMYVSDPEKYEPERWLRDGTSKRSAPLIEPFVTLPFSFGVRACPGRRIAQQEIAVFLIKFFQKFGRCTYDGEEASMIMRLNYVPDRPLHFTLDDKIN